MNLDRQRKHVVMSDLATYIDEVENGEVKITSAYHVMESINAMLSVFPDHAGLPPGAIRDQIRAARSKAAASGGDEQIVEEKIIFCCI